MPNGDPQETDIVKIIGGGPAPIETEGESLLGQGIGKITGSVGNIWGGIIKD